MIIEIDQKSGFCFGVTNAINVAEKALETEKFLYSLGHIVHNEYEVNRLQKLGMQIINHSEYFKLKNCKVLIRTHGEPPSTYEYATKNNITLIDATCPVVLKLQQRVKKAGAAMDSENGQVVIFGNPDHAEIIGLANQNKSKTLIIKSTEDYINIDLNRSVVLFSQTTKSLDDFKKIKQNILEHSKNPKIEIHDTICRQVSNRVSHLEKFSGRFDVIIFVGGHESSNAKVLFDVCKAHNDRSFFVANPEELNKDWFFQAETVGICGATSTPLWQMEQVAAKIEQF